MIFCRSWVMADAVTAMTGMPRVRSSARSIRSASIPLMPGSWMSMRSSAGVVGCAARGPPRPRRARPPPSGSRGTGGCRAPASGSSRCPRQSGSARRPWPLRNGEGERRSLAGLALHPQPSAVQLHEAPGQGQAEPGALALVGVVAAPLPKLLEDQLLVLGGDADAGVGHRDLYPTVGRHRADLDPAAL